MMRWLTAYGACAAVFVAMDFVWLSTTVPTFYRREIGPLLLDQPRMVPAVVFYLAYLAGVVMFVISPAQREKSGVFATVLRGGLFGLIAYGTYDLTNLATLKGFTAPLAVVDLTWGFVVTATASAVGLLAARRFG
ncbi:MAG: DUF2177 family protein [Caulobacteraceae bacterium]|nr:DUF2177 family protein [Caulobacteraceae bacterium]